MTEDQLKVWERALMGDDGSVSHLTQSHRGASIKEIVYDNGKLSIILQKQKGERDGVPKTYSLHISDIVGQFADNFIIYTGNSIIKGSDPLIGQKLKELRSQHPVYGKNVVRFADDSDLGRTTVYAIEGKKGYRPSEDAIRKYCRHLNCKIISGGIGYIGNMPDSQAVGNSLDNVLIV